MYSLVKDPVPNVYLPPFGSDNIVGTTRKEWIDENGKIEGQKAWRYIGYIEIGDIHCAVIRVRYEALTGNYNYEHFELRPLVAFEGESIPHYTINVEGGFNKLSPTNHGPICMSGELENLPWKEIIYDITPELEEELREGKPMFEKENYEPMQEYVLSGKV